MKIPVKNIQSGVLLCIAPWLFAIYYPRIHENAFEMLVIWWVMGATALNYPLWKMEYSPGLRVLATGLRLGLLGLSMVCLGGLLGQAEGMATAANLLFYGGLGLAGLGFLATCFGWINKEPQQNRPVGVSPNELTVQENDPHNSSTHIPSRALQQPKQKGVMKKAIALAVIGFAIGLAGWLIGAFGNKETGMIFFMMGWVIGATGMVIAFWNFELPAHQRLAGIGFKVSVVGFAIYALSGLLGGPDDMELTNIPAKVGQYIVTAGILVMFLGVIKNNMPK